MSEAPYPAASVAPDHGPIAAPGVPAPFRWGRRGGLLWIEASIAGARAVFSTRLGGGSEGPCRSLNLSLAVGDDPAGVVRNREALMAALERDPGGVATGRQVHGAGVQRHRGPVPPETHAGPAGEASGADIQVTDSHAVTPLVLVADCVPLVVSAPGAVAVAHCGRRGVLAGVVGNTVAAVCELAGTEPRGIAAVLGPGIGPCCYEVGRKERDAFTEAGHVHDALGKGRIDLAHVVRTELRRAGVDAHRVDGVGLCTSCCADLFFSHRRDGGSTGRQAGIAWLDR